jgi:iron complex transport system substrate-binding protein
MDVGKLYRLWMMAVAAALLVALVVGCTLGCGSAKEEAAAALSTQTITDQAGRSHTVPDPITKVYCTSPMGTNLMYMLAPELLVGWNVTPTALEKKYIPEELRPVVGLGGWYGKNTTGNVEEIVKRAPDVAFDLGDLDQAAISEADRIQGLINIPLVMVDGDLVDSGSALRYIGTLVGAEDRAEELAKYCDHVIEEAQEISATLADADKVRVYYAEGMKGLNTDPTGSSHTEVLDLVGARNVADVKLESGYGMSPVSLEQVLAWDPEVILVASDPAEESNVYEQITTSGDWATITAVKNHQVYQIPRGPFDWFDRPPCISRILGVRWLGNLLYPDLYDYDMKAEIKEFYKVFYHLELTEAQMQELTAHALRAE